MAQPHAVAAALLVVLAVSTGAWAQAAAQAAPPANAAQQQQACLLKLTVQRAQSGWRGGGNVTAPVPSTVLTPDMNATGHVYLRVPSGSRCPPNLTADSADNLLEQSSLDVPIGGKSISFVPVDIVSKMVSGEDGVSIGRLNFLGLGMGLTGTEPLGSGSVTVGNGTLAEARSAAQRVCSQLLMLGGTLDLSNDIVGNRTADVKHVAFNRTLGAGLSAKRVGDRVTNVTLLLQNVTMALNISPETTPGVEFSKATYTLAGNVVATADASNKANWVQVDMDEVAWGSVPRKDAPVVLGGNRPTPKPKIIGVNSTMAQECEPSRVLDASGAIAPAAASEPAPRRSAAGSAAAASSILAAAAAAAGLAALLA